MYYKYLKDPVEICGDYFSLLLPSVSNEKNWHNLSSYDAVIYFIVL